MLIFRAVSFAFWQMVIAVIYALQAHPTPWEASIAWWPVTATLTNGLCLILLTSLSRREGMRLLDLYGVERHQIKRELLIVFGLFVIAAPVSMLPNIALGNWLFGDVQVAGEMFFRPLPLAAILPMLVLFPVSIALTELPTYYGYVMPRLMVLSGRVWVSLLLVAFWHAAQHMALPLIFDTRFMLWRLGMFLPFALLLALCLYKRPRLLPYLMVIHGLMDLQVVVMALAVS